ncbi:MAG: hydantoinase/oxoprolinase family protein [Hyphomicrobiaceae bacterium]
MPRPSRLRVGIDIGGTFTDIVVLGSDQRIHTKKISSRTDDYAEAIVDGLLELFAETGLTGLDLTEIRHGTTIASNAILEQKGAKVGLITTEGFRDVLELRTLRMPRLYDMTWQKPPPLVERYLRRTIDERITSTGAVERPLNIDDARAQVAALIAEGVDAIAVCLINAFINPEHELMVKEVIRDIAGDLTYCISSEVLPEIKEYERTSTTVINAYVMPIVATYLRALRQKLDEVTVPAEILLMQSNGGLTTAEFAAARPINIIESGPAGGVIGAQAIAKRKSLEKIITFDMGGTTAKASMIERGNLMRAQEYAVGAGIMIGSRLLSGAGYSLKVPAIDLAEVGAGGGSLVRVDQAGSLQVGPESAAANPGPVCYGIGGQTATVTDANVVLGYLNPYHLVGGALKIDADRARHALQRQVAEPLCLSLEDAAFGAYRIAASNMIRAIRSVSSERGRDPRAFSLFSFGGNGPLFACELASVLGIKRIVIPPAPGLFSSFGLLYADVEHHFTRTFRSLIAQADVVEVASRWGELEEQARTQLRLHRLNDDQIEIRRSAALHYQGQSFELIVAAPDGEINAEYLRELGEEFGAEHERVYGHRAGPDEPIELVAIQVTGIGERDHATVPERLATDHCEALQSSPRLVYFGPQHGWIETPIKRRSEITAKHPGPLIIEEYDSTTIVTPTASAERDDGGNIVLTL